MYPPNSIHRQCHFQRKVISSFDFNIIRNNYHSHTITKGFLKDIYFNLSQVYSYTPKQKSKLLTFLIRQLDVYVNINILMAMP